MSGEQPRMNPDLKRAWVEALRSGHFRQGRGALRSKKGTFCCLGVLCEVAGLCALESPLGYWYEYESWRSNAVLPANFSVYAGIPSDVQDDLIDMNDGRGATFEEIADYIEENL